MDWKRYKQLERDEADLMRAAPIQLTVEYQEFLDFKNAVLLLRRIPGLDVDRAEVIFAALGGRIYNAFKETPGTTELRAEQMLMLRNAQDD